MPDPTASGAGDAGHEALLSLLEALRRRGYRFVTPTPATHRRVIGRPGGTQARDLRDVFGWSLPFSPGLLPADVAGALEDAGMLVKDDRGLSSAVRVSTLGGRFFLHSAFPPSASDAVFFGPDSYRFTAFVEAGLRDAAPGGILADVGTGSGVGAIVAAGACAPAQVFMSDINPAALRLARVNAAAAGIEAHFVQGRDLDALPGPFHVIVANPPFIAGGSRTYREGGDMHGARVSLDWALAGARRLAPRGRLLLYTGSAIIGGEDRFRAALEQALRGGPFTLDYRELDPDIFGGLLGSAAYADVERIAAVGAVIVRD